MIDWLLSTDGFVPRKDCGAWTPGLIWLNAGSDILIWLAYVSIPLVLGFFARHRGLGPYTRLFWLFAAFILACGFTHLTDAVMFERPMYRLNGFLRAVTAAVSWATVLALIPAVPRLLAVLARIEGANWEVVPADPEGAVRRYIVAVLAAVAAVLVRGLLDPLLAGDHAFVISLLAVVFVAWNSGFGPGLVTLAVSMVGVVFFFVEPRNSVAIARTSDQVAIGLFLFAGVGCALLGEAQRHHRARAEQNLAAARAHQRDLEAEIARRRNVEAELERERSLLDTLFKAAPVGLAFHDPELRFVRVNDALARMNGLPVEAHLGRTGPDLIPALGAAIQPVLRRVVETGEPAADVEITGETPAGGGVRHWQASYFPVDAPGGKRLGVGAVVTDVTDRRRAAEAVRASERFHRQVLDSMAAFVGVLTPDGTLVQANRSALEVAGLRPADVLGKPFPDAYWWRHSAESQARLREAIRLAAAGVASRYDADVQAAGGRRLTLDFILSPMADEAGRVTHLIPSGTDITDRKRAEEAMRESEARFRALADGAPVLIWVSGPDRGFVYVNRPWLDFTGRTMAQEYGTGWAEGIHPDDLQRVLDEFAARSAAREPFEVEFRLRRHDGEYRWVLDRGIPRYTPSGQFVGYIGSGIDVTDRRAALDQVREEKERFQTLADNMSQLAWMADETGWRFWFNRRWLEYTGLTADEGQGWGWKAAHHPDHVHRVVAKLARCLADGEPWEDTFPLRSKDGEYRWFLSRAVPIRDADGRIVRWFGTNTDVTDRMAMEAELRSSASRFRTMAETMPSMVWTATPAGVVDYYNRRWYEYTGLGEESLGDGWQAVVHPDDRAAGVERWREAVAGGTTHEVEQRLRRHDGVYRWHLIRGVAVRDSAGRVAQWVGTITDVEDQRRYTETLEEQVRRRTAELKRSNEELEKFAYVASHDLQEPLRKIQAFGDRLRLKFSGQLGDQGQEYLDRVMASATRMRTLINDLLVFSRVTTKGQAFAPVDLNRVVEDVVSDLEARIQQTGGRVDVGPLPAVEADPVQMRQLFQNLIGNALKFHKPDVPPVVTVRGEVVVAADGKSQARLTVADDGIGFDEKYRHRIFEVFQRLHGRNEYEGTGVGLAICRKIVERHGGEITAHSRPGEGATFEVSLPLTQTTASPVNPDA